MQERLFAFAMMGFLRHVWFGLSVSICLGVVCRSSQPPFRPPFHAHSAAIRTYTRSKYMFEKCTSRMGFGGMDWIVLVSGRMETNGALG